MKTVGSGVSRRLVVAAAVLVQAGFGSFNAWSIFRQPLSALYEANVTTVNGAFFVSSLVFGLAASTFGAVTGRVDPRVLGVGGALLYGTGLVLSSFAGSSLPVLYVAYGVISAVGLGMGVMAPVAALPRWFPGRPGLAYGIAFLGFGLGPALNAPLISALLSATGGPMPTFRVLGVLYAVVIGGAALLLRSPPGWRPAPTEVGGLRSDAPGLREALRTWQWYALWAVFFLNTTAGLAIISDARALAASVGHAPAALAALFIVMMSLSDTAGRLVWATLFDRFGGRNTFMVMFVLQAVAFVLLPTLGGVSFVVYCILSLGIMSCYGGGYGAITAFVSTYFGSWREGQIFGSIFSAAAFASFGAPLLFARSVDVVGSYGPALYATGALMVAGAALTVRMRPPPPSGAGQRDDLAA